MARRTSLTNPRCHAFTLMEAMAATTILSLAVVGISNVMTVSYGQMTGQESQATALALARQLMEEISARPLALPTETASNPGWSSGIRDRRLYDTVDDYNGYTDSSNSLTTLAGRSVTIGGTTTYTRSVAIATGVRPLNHTVAPASDFVAVTVTVTGGGHTVNLSEFMAATTIAR